MSTKLSIFDSKNIIFDGIDFRKCRLISQKFYWTEIIQFLKD